MKKSKKESFILYLDSRNLLDCLDYEKKGRLIEAIFAYVAGEEVPSLPPDVNMAFISIKTYLDKDRERYDRICEKRREYGKLGGLAKGSNAKFASDENSKNSNAKFAKANESKNSKAKHNDNENDNDNVNDNGNDNRDEWTLPYGTYLNVLITMDEYDALCESWKKEQVDEKIEHLSSYLKQGHEYKNHYVVLRDWLKKDYPEQRKTIGSDHMERAMNMIRIASNE